VCRRAVKGMTSALGRIAAGAVVQTHESGDRGVAVASVEDQKGKTDNVSGLLDGGRIAEVLTAISGNGWRVKQCRPQVLQASRTRPVLSYRVSYIDDHGAESAVQKIVIGKAYYRGEGTRTYDVMRELWAQGFADDPDLRIAEPLAWIPELQLLLQAPATGHALYEHMDDPAGALDEVRATGRWLAKLHAMPGGTIAPLPADHETRKLTTYCTELSRALPGSAARIAALTASVLDALRGAGRVPVVPTHGDYQAKNIYVSRGQVTVIDWDRVALAHPARDVGHFIGQSMTMSYSRAGSFDAISSWNEAFLEGYRQRCTVEFESVLPAYVARTFLEILYYKLVVKPVRDPSFLPAWLDECERWIDLGLVQPAEATP
jgi:hypothetical protein